MRATRFVCVFRSVAHASRCAAATVPDELKTELLAKIKKFVEESG